MRFEVPQFIEIEDKIIGPFTWRQFVYVAGGGGAVVILYLWGLPMVIFLLIALPIAGLAGALAFYPVNNRPFSLFLESIFQYLFSKKLYLWRRRGNTVYGTESADSAIPSSLPNPDGNKTNLASLSRKLELNDMEPETNADIPGSKDMLEKTSRAPQEGMIQ